MAWLPFEKYELTSPLTLAQIAQRVTDDDEGSEYTATLQDDIINIETSTRFKVGGYSQSFKPAASILVKQTASGLHAVVTLKPKRLPVALLVLIVIVFMGGIWYSQRNSLLLGRYKDAIVACAGLLILSYLLPVTAFNADQSKIKSFINYLFQVDQES
jgi:hypothetical protein